MHSYVLALTALVALLILLRQTNCKTQENFSFKSVANKVKDTAVDTTGTVKKEVKGVVVGDSEEPKPVAKDSEDAEDAEDPEDTEDSEDAEGSEDAEIEIPGTSCKDLSIRSCKNKTGEKRDRCLQKKLAACRQTKKILDSMRDDNIQNLAFAAKILSVCNKAATDNAYAFEKCKGTRGKKRTKCITPLRKKCFEKMYKPISKSKTNTPDALFQPLVFQAAKF